MKDGFNLIPLHRHHLFLIFIFLFQSSLSNTWYLVLILQIFSRFSLLIFHFILFLLWIRILITARSSSYFSAKFPIYSNNQMRNLSVGFLVFCPIISLKKKKKKDETAINKCAWKWWHMLIISIWQPSSEIEAGAGAAVWTGKWHLDSFLSGLLVSTFLASVNVT